MTTTIKAYWLNGTAYCAGCVECATPCLGEAEIAQATAANGVGRCACCGEVFADGDIDQAKPVKSWEVRLPNRVENTGLDCEFFADKDEALQAAALVIRERYLRGAPEDYVVESNHAPTLTYEAWDAKGW